jgi:uncharacterized protein involved in type VI secretion and phage assembly
VSDGNSLEQHWNELAPGGLGGRMYGVMPALVTDIRDDDGRGRVKVSLPLTSDPSGARYEAWARIATLMGGNNRGSWFIPEVNDEVLVAFEMGDPRRPYVVGALWNGSDAPPETMDANNTKKVIRSKTGVKITIDDTQSNPKIVIETPGRQKVTLQDSPGMVELTDGQGNYVKIESSGITLNTSGRFSVSASTIDMTAGSLSVSANVSNFSGMVQANTAMAPAVIGSSYTPGAGNIW